MTFATPTYLVFLLVTFTLCWATRQRRWQNLVLLGASYSFYAWWDVRFCSLMLISSLVDYAVGGALHGTDDRAENRARRAMLLAVSLVVNLGMLGFFKYHGFFVESLQSAITGLGVDANLTTLDVILPVGISFYTFQTMSYTIDLHRGRGVVSDRLLDYLTYVSFFPQLVAGPIERAARLLPQFATRRVFDHRAAVDGCRQILWGLVQKVLLADNLAPIVDRCYADPETFSGPQLAYATFCFAFQIYCDFAAYSNIAIGTGKLFGVELMQNFAYPYFSRDIAEFWRRWHISLSTWFRDYVYIPLGGNRRRPARVALNIMVTFVLSGLWHGASWNFVIWGAINGAALVPLALWRGTKRRGGDTPGGERLFPGLRDGLAILGTFAVTCLAWVFFRAPDLAAAGTILGRVAADLLSPGAYAGALVGGVLPLALVVVFVVVEWIQRRHAHPLMCDSWPLPARWGLYTVLLWSALTLRPGSTSPFIYFQF